MVTAVESVQTAPIFEAFGPRQALWTHALLLPELPHDLHQESRFSWAEFVWGDLVDVHAWLAQLHRAAQAGDLAAVAAWVAEHPAAAAPSDPVTEIADMAERLVTSLSSANDRLRDTIGMAALPRAIPAVWRDAVDEYLDALAKARTDDAEDTMLGVAELILKLQAVASELRTDAEHGWASLLAEFVRDGLGCDTFVRQGLYAAVAAADMQEAS